MIDFVGAWGVAFGVFGLWHAHRDVNSRKANRSSVNRSSEHPLLSSVLDRSPDIVRIVDSNGSTVFLNQAGRRLLGYDLDEDVSRISTADVHPEWALTRIETEAYPIALLARGCRVDWKKWAASSPHRHKGRWEPRSSRGREEQPRLKV